ncbi:hypothetical protein [Lysinibacillus sp. ACHW1.5]|uniref:hypothetical protein n=1 Tax=Lysinibacillus sp. ACHW1.5 TaxID=2913506 RepID=UPI001EDA382D|nr:hypothetical protein [Lysinibacillus sp. ACHW1.5]UKJ44679.1 hypothetical protein L6W14_18445 [Lysinibacillus sp. ACHW1.5]
MKHTSTVKLDDVLIFYEFSKEKSSNSLRIKDLLFENVVLSDDKSNSEKITILITRKIKYIHDIKIALVNNKTSKVIVDYNLLKFKVDINAFYDAGFEESEITRETFSKYIAYYLLSTKGKAQLAKCFDTNENDVIQTLNISYLKEICIPFYPRIKYVVEEIENQIHWKDAENYSNQLDYSESMFKAFESIIASLKNSSTTTYFVQKDLFTANEFGLMMAKYLANTPFYDDIMISVVLESAVHYRLFEIYQEKDWEEETVEFFSPHQEIEGDIIIVIRKPNQRLNLPKHAKIIYLEER